MVYQCWNTTKKFCRLLFFSLYGLYANVTWLPKVFLYKYLLNFYVVHRRGSLVSRQVLLGPGRLKLAAHQIGSYSFFLIKWLHVHTCLSVHCSPTYLHGILLPNTAGSTVIPSVKRHFFKKMWVFFKPKWNMSFLNHNNSHRNYSMVPLMMLPTTEQWPEQITCEILEKNQ